VVAAHRSTLILSGLIVVFFIGCQLAWRGPNRFGSVAKAASDANVDFNQGKYTILTSMNVKTAEFNELSSCLKTFGINLEARLTQCSEEADYIDSYNRAMNTQLKVLHGRDVFTESCSKVFNVVYFPKEDEKAVRPF